MRHTFSKVFYLCGLVVLALAVMTASPVRAVDVHFDIFPGPDGKFGNTDDIVVTRGTAFTNRCMIAGVIV